MKRKDTADAGLRLIRYIDNRQAVILRNHGLLAWDRAVPQALAVLWLFNRI